MNTDEIRQRLSPPWDKTCEWKEEQLRDALNEIDRLRLENRAIITSTEATPLYMMTVKLTKDACKKAVCATDFMSKGEEDTILQAIDSTEVT